MLRPSQVSQSSPSSLRVELLDLMVGIVRSPVRTRLGPQKVDHSPRGPNDRYIGLPLAELTKAIREKTGRAINSHDVVHVLYSLQKAELVSFQTSKREAKNGNGVPLRIMVTKKALDNHYEALKVAAALEDEPVPLEPPEAPTQADEMPEPPPARAPTPSLPDPARVMLATPGGPVPPELYLVAHFPNIVRAVRAAQHLQEAARLLELAGQADVAGLALDAMSSRSPLELEVAEFFGPFLGGPAREAEEGGPSGEA